MRPSAISRSARWAAVPCCCVAVAAAAVILGSAATPIAAARLLLRRQAAAWDRERFERFGGPGGGPRPPIAPFTTEPLPARRVVVPLVFPVIGARSWRDGYNVNRGNHRHTGIDILAPKMRPIVAPFSGVLGFKTQTFWIWGDNGYKCLGTHLNDDTPGTNDNRADPDAMFAPNLRPGDRVVAGQLLGYVGDSGVASGPHLHFELFAPGNELVNPFPSLKAAGRVTAPRTVLNRGAPPPAPGQTRLEGCVRGWDPARRTLTLLLTARQAASGRTVASAAPTRLRVILPPPILQAAGGNAALATLPRDRALTLYVAEPAMRGHAKSSDRGGANLFVQRLILPALSPATDSRRDD